MRDMAEIKRLIEALESDEGYFGMVQQISSDEALPIREAFFRVEQLRVELGLRHRYTSENSFRVCRHRFHQSGGEISRFIEPESLSPE